MGHWSFGELILAVVFTVVLGLLVYLDLFVLNKKAHKIPFKESIYWSFFGSVLRFPSVSSSTL
ncbi:hypothetical protein LEP1GSC188_3268 [Leptospira weilii serovar Topaz str. LT2116]|uniref:Uncharacterized protein n=1 Tax=Leptospira weilii serovar Topaz str. LT2116 TaxID=1088540 RepID=M3GZ88_9LEPT|nr:hypothetical protein LEP1GSC188_3268 [Leptospira weilii serovar Topaz str. LT2116]